MRLIRESVYYSSGWCCCSSETARRQAAAMVRAAHTEIRNRCGEDDGTLSLMMMVGAGSCAVADAEVRREGKRRTTTTMMVMMMMMVVLMVRTGCEAG